MEPKIIDGDKVFKDNTLIKIGNTKYRLRFIKVGNKYTIELHGIDPVNYKVIGEMINGKAVTGNHLFHAVIIEES